MMTNNRELFAKHVGLGTFVETGTCHGRSVALALDSGFNRALSVEGDEARYKGCVERFKHRKEVLLWHGDSTEKLPEMVAHLKHAAIFLLDAHPSGDGSYGQDYTENPAHAQSNILRAELNIIRNHPVHGHVILIDDLTPDIEEYARTLFADSIITKHDTDEGVGKVLEIQTPRRKSVNLSQDNESEIIAEFFGDYVGSFIDIGCSAGVALSNTFQLGLKGWRGLLVEAAPNHFQNLLGNYVHRGGVEMINAALWTERKLMRFHYSQWYYSSLIEKPERDLYQAHYWVPTITVDDLKAIQPEAQFISLDIEGADILVFPSLAAAYPDCQLFAVEHAKDEALKAQWLEMFTEHKMNIIATTPENFIVSK